MLNGFLQSQGFPKKTHFDVAKPSETLSNLIDFGVKKHLSIDIKSMPYVKPAVGYIQDVLKLGKNREYLQKMNTTDVSNKLTDTLNLEVNNQEDVFVIISCIINKLTHVCVYFCLHYRSLNQF
jgi:hypothetical protein